jgi:transcriptional regulator with XRE-family HTH domain
MVYGPRSSRWRRCDVPPRRDKNPYLQKLGARVRELRKLRGWTQEELEGRTSLTVSYISRVETGDQNPSILTLRTLARALGMSIAALLPPE